jgi:tetratricopeptide (TPR) repeat protein
LACVLAFVGLCWRAIHVLLRRDRDPFGRLFAGCAAFVLASQAVHSFVDFPLYAPANLILFALWMGAACGRACRLTGENAEGKSYRGVLAPVGRWTGSAATVAAIALVAAAWAWREAHVQESLDLRLREHARLPANQDTPLSLAGLWVEQWHAVAAQHPQSTAVQRRLAERWIDRCRVQAMEELLAKQPRLDRKQVWLATDLNRLYAQVMSAARLGRQADLEGLRKSPPIAHNLHHAKDRLLAACRLDPLNPEPRLRLAQLGFLFPSATVRERLATSGSSLAPGDADVQFRVGELEFHADRPNQTAQAWRKSLSLSPRHLSAIYFYSVNWLGLQGMLEKIFPPDSRLLVALAETQFSKAEDFPNRKIVLERAEKVFSQTALPLAERHELAGRIAMNLHNWADAETHLLQAVAADGRKAIYRHRLSLAYERQNKVDLALEAAVAAAALDRGQPMYASRAVELQTRVSKRAPESKSPPTP